MNYKILISTLLISSLLLVTSCSKKSPSVEEAAKRMVAFEEPGVIMSMEIKSLLDKGGITTKENIPMIAQMLFSDKIEYMSNPEKIGLDLTGKSFMAVSGGKKGTVVWSVTKIKDKEKFEKMLKDEGNEKFEEVEGYNTIVEKDEMILGWNESLLIMMVSQGKEVKEIFKKYVEAIKEEKNPSATFTKFFEAKGDGAMLTNFDKFEALQKNMPSEIRGNESEMKILNRLTNKMKGSSSLFTIKFENDKVVTDIAHTFSDNLKKEMDFFAKDGLPKELMNEIGSNELNGFFSVNGNVKGYVDWLTQIMGEDDVFAELEEKSGLDVMRMVKSLKGNLLCSFLGFIKQEYSNIDENGNESKYEYNIPQFSIITTLNDNYIETIVDSVLKDKKKGNYYVGGNQYNPQYIAFKPGLIFYTNDENLVMNPLAKANPELDPNAAKVLAQPLSFYVNLNKIIASSEKSEMAQKIAKKFKCAYGGMSIDGGHAELILNNGGKNSLWTLINLTVESTAEMGADLIK